MAKSARGASKDHPFANVPVINPAQLGGIETSVLDDGPGRGNRIAWAPALHGRNKDFCVL